MNVSYNAEQEKILSEISGIELILNSNLPTTLWISDLHGEGERFKRVLRGRFGMLFQTCVEALPKTFSKEKVSYITKIIRKGHFFEDAGLGMDIQDVILCLRDVLRYKLLNTTRHYRDVIPPLFRQTIYKLINFDDVPDLYFENKAISDRLIHDLCVTVKRSILDHLVVLGDIFDRGPDPDTIIRILKSPVFRKNMTLIYGNHDILWMGACAGNLSMIAETLRITYRYDHKALLERLGLNMEKLEEFAARTYPADRIGGKYKAKGDLARSVEKALSIIQFKLEETCILRHPEYEMDSRLWLERLCEKLRAKKHEGLNDLEFPTLDLDNPHRLGEEEREIIEDLSGQFGTNKKLMSLMRIFFTHGQAYHVHNSILNMHALIPSTENGGFDKFMGYSGKGLLDFFQETIGRVGDQYLNSLPRKQNDLDIFFYLWCGPKSPLFGKDAMKTFERYFLIDKATHKETTLYWEKNLKKPEFRQLLKNEFGVERVIYGHTPRDYTKGQKIADEEGFAINVDGGFAKAYFDRGHALVHTPRQLYGIVLPTREESRIAAEEKRAAPIQVEIIKNFIKPVKIKDTFLGKQYIAKKNKLLKQLE